MPTAIDFEPEQTSAIDFTPEIDFQPEQTATATTPTPSPDESLAEFRKQTAAQMGGDFLPAIPESPSSPNIMDVTAGGPQLRESGTPQAAWQLRQEIKAGAGQMLEPLYRVSDNLKLSKQQVADAVDTLAGAAAAYGGILSGEKSPEKIFAEVAGQKQRVPTKAEAIVAGADQAITQSLDFFTSPVGIATLGTGALPKVAQRAISLAFVAQMSSQLPEQWRQFNEARQAGDVEGMARGLTGMGLSGAFITAAGIHAASPELKALAPATARAVEEIPQPKESNAETIRSDTGQLPPQGQNFEGSQAVSRNDLEQPSPKQPEPVVARESLTPETEKALAESAPATPVETPAEIKARATTLTPEELNTARSDAEARFRTAMQEGRTDDAARIAAEGQFYREELERRASTPSAQPPSEPVAAADKQAVEAVQAPPPPPEPSTPESPRAVQGEGKQPWEYTKSEWSKLIKAEYGRQGFPDLAAKQATDATHAREVADAVKAGKPVPPEVLADYPDLQPKPAAKEAGKSRPMNMAGQVRQPRPTKPPPPSFESIHPRSREKFNAAWEARDAQQMGLLLDPMNRGMRAEWERRTGEKLPRTIGDMHIKVRNYFLMNPKAEPIVPEAPSQAISKAQAEVSSVAKNEGMRPAKVVKAELVDRIESALLNAPQQSEFNSLTGKPITDKAKSAPATIKIEIPGDGEFTLVNRKEAIQQVLTQAKRISPSSTSPAKTAYPKQTGDIAAQAEAAAKAYGSPENAYRSLARQLDELRNQEPPRTAEERKQISEQIDAGEFLLKELYGNTQAGKLEAQAEAARDRVATYKEGARGFESEIAKLESRKRLNPASQDRLKDLKERYAQNQDFIKTNERNAEKWEQQAAKEKAALETKPTPPPTELPSGGKEAPESKTVRQSLMLGVTRTPAVKSLLRDIEDGISYVADLPIEKAKLELVAAKKNWESQLETLRKIEAGKSEPAGMDLKSWDFDQAQAGKIIPAVVWASDYAIPRAEAMLRDIERTRSAIEKLENRKAKAALKKAADEEESISEGPGAASPGDVPQKSQIEQLGSAFKGGSTQRQTLREKVKEIFDLKNQKEITKDLLARTLSSLKTAGDYLINTWKGQTDLDPILKSKGLLSAELEMRGWRMRQAMKDMKRAVPDLRVREAISKYVDAGGDMEKLRSAAESVPESKRAPYIRAMQLTPEEKVFAGHVQSYFESRLQEAIDAGVLRTGIEDYIHRIYPRETPWRKGVINAVQNGVLDTRKPGLAMKRVFELDSEAEKAGYHPVSDFIPRILDYEASLSKVIASRAAVKRFTEITMPDGRPMLDVSGIGIPVENAEGIREATLIKPSYKPGEHELGTDGKPTENYRQDYQSRDYSALKKWKWATKDEAGNPIFVEGNVLIHPDAVHRIDALLRPSGIRQYGVGRAALGVGSVFKQTMLDFSGFHQVQIAIHGLEHRVNPFNLVKEINFEDPNIQGLLRGGMTIGGEHATGMQAEGLVGRSLSRQIPGIGPLMRTYHEWLFQDFIPRVKTTMAIHALERNRARFKNELASGKMTEDALYYQTAKEANAAFGGLNYIMLERSKTVQDLARLTLLAPDFLEARGRFVAQAGTRLGAEQRMALFLGALTLYAVARVMNKTTDDLWHFEPENAFSVVHNGKAYSIRTVQGDVLHALEEPVRFWLHRLNPTFTRPALELMTQRDEFGRKRDFWQTMGDTISNLIPISMRSSREQKLWTSILNAFGGSVRRYSEVQHVAQAAQEWKKKNGIRTEPGEFIYDPSKDIYRPLKLALLDGDSGAAQVEYKRLVDSKQVTASDIGKHFNRYANAPFTGSTANEARFKQSLSAEKLKEYEAARQERKRVYNAYLKMGGASGGSTGLPSLQSLPNLPTGR